jgi:hypothetical protein
MARGKTHYLRRIIACIADHPAKRIGEFLPWSISR